MAVRKVESDGQLTPLTTVTVYPANLPNPNQWNATANPLTAGINVSVKATIYVKRQKANGTWETLEYSTVGTTTVSGGGGSGGEG